LALSLIAAFAAALLLPGATQPARSADPDGSLDPNFGTGGKVLTDFSNSEDAASAVAIQGDGKIVAAGSFHAGGPYDFALARYNANGSLDTSFGSGGKVVTDVCGCYQALNALAIQGDGKIVAAGVALASSQGSFTLARYSADGILDPSFGSGGKVLTAFGNAYAVAIQGDGKIVAAGYSSGSPNFRWGLARYNPDGSLDTSFGSGGKVVTDFGLSGPVVGGAFGLAILGDGKIVAAGLSGPYRAWDFALARYNANGSLDTSFGSGGKVVTDFGGGSDEVHAVAIQGDGKIVAAGSALASGVIYDYNFALARYSADGILDTTFGSGGKVLTSFGGSESMDVANGLAIQGDGKIAAGGYANYGDFALARYSADGNLDTSFGSGGKVVTDFGGTSSLDQAFAIAIQGDGKIVAAGGSYASGSLDFAIARYLGGSSADTTPPVISGLPTSITAEATGPTGAMALWADPTATDPDDEASPPVCSPASGSTFPLGTTTVTCTSSDTHANTGSASFTVSVVDTTPPSLGSWDGGVWTIWATGPTGGIANFAGTAVDLVDGSVSVTFEPPPGTLFPIGRTSATASAVDAHGNRASATFLVEVVGAADQVSNLIAALSYPSLPRGTVNALAAPLRAAQKGISKGATDDACNALADFVEHVRAQSGKKLLVSDADHFIMMATRIEAVLACGG
jgi:uncharacterized delta-60 repeat protein